MNTYIKESLDFNKTKIDIVNFLDNHQYMSFATSYKNRVTVRTVTYANNGLNIYFLSFKHHTKCFQISKNSKVASCIDTLQIEGRAKILGHPLNENNQEYINLLKTKLPTLFKPGATFPEMVLIEMEPIHFVNYVRNLEGANLEHLNIEDNTAYISEKLKFA